MLIFINDHLFHSNDGGMEQTGEDAKFLDGLDDVMMAF
jgi:hypothetical protein